MKLTTIKSFILAILFISISACEYIPTLDEVVPDKRSEYRKSRSLPDLEVPPDLTIEREDDLVIPGESEPTTLSAYELQKKRGGLSQLEALEQQYPGEKVLPVAGGTVDVWPDLIGYFKDKGYEIDLEDAELGVLETTWLATGDSSRDKFKIFAEPSETGNNTILFISSERQEKIGLGDTNVEWLEQEADERKTNRYVAEIKTMFYGTSDVIAATPAGSSTSPEPIRPQAILESAGDKKYLLRLPESFDSGWSQTAELLERAGARIEKTDSSKGIFYVLYQPQVTQPQEEKGFFSKLKFWGDDEPDTSEFQISVTGLEGNTEIVVLDDDGDWNADPVADTLLSAMLDAYNR